MTTFNSRGIARIAFTLLAAVFVLTTVAPLYATDTVNTTLTQNANTSRYDITMAGSVTYGMGLPSSSSCDANKSNYWYIRKDAWAGNEAYVCVSGSWRPQRLNALDILQGLPVCQKTTIGFAAITAAGTTKDITLFTAPARMAVDRVYVKHSTAFAGGAVSAATVSVGVSGALTAYTSNFDIFQAVAATALQYTAGKAYTTAAHDVVAHFISTSANLDALTAGSVDITVCYRAIQ